MRNEQDRIEDFKDRIAVWAMVVALVLGFLWGCLVSIPARLCTRSNPDDDI